MPASGPDAGSYQYLAVVIMCNPTVCPPVPLLLQFYGQKLLVGQEGAECCLMSFNPPGSSTARAAAAWGFGSNNHTSGYGSAGAACYGMSPGAPGAYAGYEDGGNVGEAGGSRGGKGKKKGATKVPPKKQTRYPKRATR